MEDKSPTMPYMLLRNFRVHQTRSTSQGQISECEYFAPNPVECPRCEARDVVFYDHYERRANFLLKGGRSGSLSLRLNAINAHTVVEYSVRPLKGSSHGIAAV